MSETEKRSAACVEVEENLALVLEGSAPATLYDHIAECDDCRDLKHDASMVAQHVSIAGWDFKAPDGFADALVARVEAERPEGPAGVAPRSTDHAKSSAPIVEVAAPAPQPAQPEPAKQPIDPGVLEHAPTVIAPMTFATEHSPQPSALRGQVKTMPLPVTPIEPARAPSTIADEPVAQAKPKTIESAPVVVHAPTPAPAASAPQPSTTADAKPAKVVEPTSIRAATKGPSTSSRSLLKRPVFYGAVVGAMAAAACVGFFLKNKSTTNDATAQADGPWSGTVAGVSRAAADKTGGAETCDLKGACSPVADGAVIKAGWTVKTDARTRARFTLGDGTELALDRDTEVVLEKGAARTATLKRGMIVADVAHVDGKTAHVAFPHGDVEVIGTKLAVSATDDRASVEVARGTVKVTNDAGKTIDVRAGEEATLVRGAEPQVAASASIADTMEWSDKSPEEVDSPVLRGLGELRARKPGQTNEKDHAVRLAKHSVKVRAVDLVARTEVDETFANDSDDELEGIFRFPLPPGAQIEKLALEVNGKLEEGAFVDRERGAAIWRGVIQNAAPTAPKPREEIVWVPGPWRDPALLEWQRGGRFELKIFPIPKHGSRRVVLTYTQTVEQAAGIRRFTYPLAHDASGTTKVDSFDLDVQVLGADKNVPITTRGYELASASGGEGDRRTMHADQFVPAGDLTVEYALPDRDKDVTAWAYQMAPGPIAPPDAPTAAPASNKPKTSEQKAAEDAAAAVANNTSPYVAIALRPRLPRWQEQKERVHVIVVDSSRSMFGERFARARHLASSIVREMDRRDSFVLLACDVVCRPMTAENGGAARPQAPGASAAGDVEKFLGSIEPDGASDLSASIAAARAAAGSLAGKELRVIYLSDGTPTAGPTRPGHLELAVRHAMPAGDGAVVSVALGADSDMTSLQALARGGGGVVVPYVPGQKVSSAALDVLGAAYGTVLRDPEVELPAGLTEVAPTRLDPIRAGGEAIIVARLAQGAEVNGQMKLRGKVAGDKFEQTYPLKVVASTSAGNGFVPRLYAAAKIAELERNGGDLAKPTVIELSKRFAVASRYTSLLVLESEAMFKAFGVERTANATTFTGEQSAESESGAAEDAPREEASAGEVARGGGLGSLGGASHTAPAKKAPAADLAADDFGDGRDRSATKAEKSKDKGDGFGFGQPPSTQGAPMGPGGFANAAPKEAPAPSPPPPPPAATVAADPAQAGVARKVAPPSRPARRFVPMRKVFDRKASFELQNVVAQQNATKLTAAEAAHTASPDSRDKTIDLFALYATAGRLGEAQELTSKWAGRDALDPDALQARSDLAARQGDRDRAVRILGGLADVRPNDKAIQARLADLFDAQNNRAVACEHRLALADLAPGDVKLVSDAVKCSREQGLGDLASQIEIDAGDKVRAAVDKLLATPPAPSTNASTGAVRGDVQVSATWSGNADVDIALIDPQGKRTSWLGSSTRATVTSLNPTSTHDETLGLVGLPQGNYVVEVSRASGGDVGDVVRGDLTLRLPGGETRRVPFTLTGARAEVGTVRVFFTARLVPVNPWDFGGF